MCPELKQIFSENLCLISTCLKSSEKWQWSYVLANSITLAVLSHHRIFNSLESSTISKLLCLPKLSKHSFISYQSSKAVPATILIMLPFNEQKPMGPSKTDPTTTSSAFAPLWSTWIIVRRGTVPALFSQLLKPPPNQRCYVTWWPWAHRPQPKAW